KNVSILRNATASALYLNPKDCFKVINPQNSCRKTLLNPELSISVHRWNQDTLRKLFQIRLQVDACYICIGMPHDRSNNRERRFHLQKHGTCAMTQGVESRMTVLIPADACFAHVINDPVFQMIIIRKRIKRRHMLYKNNIRIIILRTSVFDIVNDRPPYRIWYRERKRLMRFMLDNGKFFIVPVEVAKPVIFDIADPQPKNTCKIGRASGMERVYISVK